MARDENIAAQKYLAGKINEGDLDDIGPTNERIELGILRQVGEG